MHIVERKRRETAREYAFRIIKSNIVSLDLLPGSLVSENELAGELGISRTPVREAFIELSKLKIVEIYPQKGSFISLIDSDLVEEARFLRQILETAVIEIACDNATEEDLLRLEEKLRIQAFYMENTNLEKKMQLDNEFHEIFFDISKKQFTYDLLSEMMTHFDRVRSLSLSTIKDSKVISDHQGLVEAVRKRDKEAAKEQITRHLSRYKVDEKELREQYPEYFK